MVADYVRVVQSLPLRGQTRKLGVPCKVPKVWEETTDPLTDHCLESPKPVLRIMLHHLDGNWPPMSIQAHEDLAF